MAHRVPIQEQGFLTAIPCRLVDSCHFLCVPVWFLHLSRLVYGCACWCFPSRLSGFVFMPASGIGFDYVQCRLCSSESLHGLVCLFFFSCTSMTLSCALVSAAAFGFLCRYHGTATVAEWLANLHPNWGGVLVFSSGAGFIWRIFPTYSRLTPASASFYMSWWMP